ncbi:MAG: amidoligase family protein, partial [Pseudomonadota bacterium]
FLPTPHGPARRCGIEIEFGGISAEAAADCVATQLGGQVGQSSKGFEVSDSAIGRIEVYLDTAFEAARKDGPLGQLARRVIPVEIVTEPLEQGELPHVNALCDALARIGATGTRDGLLLGFGVHLNVEVPQDFARLLRICTAFALCDDLLRDLGEVDGSRRVVPFIDPWPRRFADWLVDTPDAQPGDLIARYLKDTPNRNRALDLLPALAHLDEDQLRGRLPKGHKLSPRPAFHYRLPDCRIDEANWSVALEWNRWVILERIADDPVLLADMRRAWRKQRADWSRWRGDWPATVGKLIEARRTALLRDGVAA